MADIVLVDRKKLAELIVYFAHEGSSDPLFSSTRLNMLMFIADFWAYAYLGKSITGIQYIHQERGPTPFPADFAAARDTLIAEGRLRIEEEDTYMGLRKRPVTDSTPHYGLFTKQEIQICEAALEMLKHKNDTEARDWLYEINGWRYTRDGEEIPYNTVYLWRHIPITADDLQWGQDTARTLGLA